MGLFDNITATDVLANLTPFGIPYDIARYVELPAVAEVADTAPPGIFPQVLTPPDNVQTTTTPENPTLAKAKTYAIGAALVGAVITIPIVAVKFLHRIHVL